MSTVHLLVPAGRRFRCARAALACSAARGAAEGALDEIVVTAQRRVERLQDVPIAITALSAADLTDRGVRQAGDITASVPNMLLNSPYGPEAQPTFTLRGVTTQDYSQNQSSPIAMYVDEVYKPVGAVQALQIYDLDRVEVLRGPQGTLYGKNATGGAVSFYSKKPEPHRGRRLCHRRLRQLQRLLIERGGRRPRHRQRTRRARRGAVREARRLGAQHRARRRALERRRRARRAR